jgi:hypothetical protein
MPRPFRYRSVRIVASLALVACSGNANVSISAPPDAGPLDAALGSDASAPTSDSGGSASSDGSITDAAVAADSTVSADAAALEAGSPDAAEFEGGSLPCVAASGNGAMVALPAQSGSVSVGFDLSVAGAPSSGGITQIAITDDRGTIELDGESVPTIVYNDVSGGTSFQGLAVGANHWAIFWPYCTGNDLTWVDYETSDSPGLVRSAASGSCSYTTTAVPFSFSWPAESVVIDSSSTSTFTMQGTSLSFAGASAGSVTFGGSSWNFWPFAVVDCTTCGSGPGNTGGWYELHVLLETGSSCANACFGIFYLYLEGDGTNLTGGAPVLLGWLNCLPDLAPPPGGGTQNFEDATWTNP